MRKQMDAGARQGEKNMIRNELIGGQLNQFLPPVRPNGERKRWVCVRAAALRSAPRGGESSSEGSAAFLPRGNERKVSR